MLLTTLGGSNICSGNVWSSMVVCEPNLMVTGMIGLGMVAISSLPGSMMIVDNLAVD